MAGKKSELLKQDKNVRN